MKVLTARVVRIHLETHELLDATGLRNQCVCLQHQVSAEKQGCLLQMCCTICTMHVTLSKPCNQASPLTLHCTCIAPRVHASQAQGGMYGTVWLARCHVKLILS